MLGPLKVQADDGAPLDSEYSSLFIALSYYTVFYALELLLCVLLFLSVSDRQVPLPTRR